jgi:hypothetical protein
MPRCVGCGKYITEGEAFWIQDPKAERMPLSYLRRLSKTPFWNPCPCFCLHCANRGSSDFKYINAVTQRKNDWILTTKFEIHPVLEEFLINNP